jgi:TonB-linked SusC/RagA family outer membrane protein
LPSGVFPVYNPNGSFGGTQEYDNNPVAALTSTGIGQPNLRQFSITGRLVRDMSSILEGLEIEGAIRYYSSGSFYESRTQGYNYQEIGAIRNSAGQIVDTTYTQYGQQTGLNYADSFGEGQRFNDITGKANYQTSWSDHTLDATLMFHQSQRSFNGQNNVYRRQNFFGNVHLGFSNKYFLNLSASYSGNNLLPSGERFGIFPAVSGGWLISNEDFLSENNFINQLKIRASWGLTGSDRLPTNEIYQQNYFGGGNGYFFQNGNTSYGGFYEAQLPTLDFTYETSRKSNIGIDLKLFNRLTFTTDFFYEHRTDILTGTFGTLSEVIGNTTPSETDGVVNNKGFETSLLWQDNFGDFGYKIGGQLSFARNEVENINEQFRPEEYLERTGQQVGQSYGLEVIGFFEDKADIESSPEHTFYDVQPGDLKYKDQNDDGLINEFDETPIGYSQGYPEIYYSFSFGLNYKGLGFNALFQGTSNYSANLTAQSIYWPLQGNNSISEWYYKNRWTPEMADNATLPRLSSEDNPNNYRNNDLWLVDRSYLKLRNVELSYSLPPSITQKLRVSQLRFYARGNNLFSIDDIPVLDPEQLHSGYPLLRSYSLGVEMNF